jgi:hypothetical protein
VPDSWKDTAVALGCKTLTGYHLRIRVVNNSHYLARHLTKPWEIGERQLRHYEVAADRFGQTSSRNLFSLDEPYPEHVEKLFNRELETPLAAFVQRLDRARDAKPTVPELRAMKLAILIQGVRTGTRRRIPDAMQDLHDIGAMDSTWFENLASTAELVFDFFGMPVRSELLCYPSTGVFPLPILGAASGYALPVHPGYFFAAVPKGWTLEPFVQVSRSEEVRDRAVTALSCGTWMADRIVLPPAIHSHAEEQQREFVRSSKDIGSAIVARALRFNYRVFGTISPGRPKRIPARLV